MASYLYGIIAILLLASACRQPVSADKIINKQASVPDSFGLDNMYVITTSINKRQHLMTTVYGNRIAVDRARSDGPAQPNEKRVLVCWKQKADENWFGAKIPDRIQSIEVVECGSDTNDIQYKSFKGDVPEPVTDTALKARRIKDIFAMQMSIMP